MGVQKNTLATTKRFSTNGILEDMEIKFFEGAEWAKIFEHNNHAKTVLFSGIADCLHSETTDKYSRLYLLDYFENINSKYEFLLEYPDDAPTSYNRWIQNNNPCNEFVPTSSTEELYADGYEAVHIDWSSQHWGGMTRHSSSTTAISGTYLSGSVGSTNWFFAIGACSSYGSGIPSYNSTANRVQLWVRIDNLPEETKCQITKNNIIANDFYEI